MDSVVSLQIVKLFGCSRYVQTKPKSYQNCKETDASCDDDIQHFSLLNGYRQLLSSLTICLLGLYLGFKCSSTWRITVVYYCL